MDAAPPTGRKILIVEDELFIGELYSHALTKAGYVVTIEPDGMKGLSLALTNQFDLIMLDIMIPNMIGIEVLKHLREEQPELKAKIVVATNLDQDPETRANIQKQADGYLVKAEVTPKQLVEFLNNIK